jgi:branched-chain amino acid transport system substrate-binding protein
MERQRFFLGLMALAVNAKFNYSQYFVMIPTGPHPTLALTEGFFEVAGQQSPRPETVAILIADAPFSQGPAQGAKEHLARHGMRVVFEGKYPLSTTEFAPYMDDLKRINPDVLFLCSYINDSIGLVKAMNTAGLSPKMVGGAMIGPQNGVVKTELGTLLNGLVNYEYWLPVPSLTSHARNRPAPIRSVTTSRRSHTPSCKSSSRPSGLSEALMMRRCRPTLERRHSKR